MIAAVALADCEHNDVGNNENGEEEANKEEGLEELTDGEPVVLIVLVEVFLVHFLDERSVIEDDHVGNQRWLEGVIQIRDQSEVIDLSLIHI